MTTSRQEHDFVSRRWHADGMGRGPRRQRVKFRAEPEGATTREFVRREKVDPLNARDEHGNPLRTLENRHTWQAESDRLADWILTLHPATQRKMTAFVVRCPIKGCLLGRVYRRGSPETGVRYLWLGVTQAGRGTAGFLNWAWDGGRGSKEFMVSGCKHGTGNVEIGMLLDMAEALDFPPPSTQDDWLRHYSDPVQRGYARRTIVLPDTHWQAWP
ncbi:hypothetical protein [Amycolatopsis sp. cmx-4-68]|uniref:hypothetical protein n=1 Tax=Amycolatopsis sp. cmx-4-68 TaxID=2790938 RepID=UPI00397B9EB5